MTPDQITQLRQTLKKALGLVAGERITYDTFPAKNHLDKMLEQEYRVCEVEIEKVLDLLPCPACNGSEIKKPASGCGRCLAGDGNCRADCPCPDCE